MSRPILTPCVLLVAVVAGCLAFACSRTSAQDGPEAAPADRPDLLLVTVDTLRADHLPTYGYGRDTAPFFAEWAAGGVVFDRAYSTSSWTVPAVTSFTTGVYPPSHGAIHGLHADQGVAVQERIPDGMVTLAQVLRKAGYRTVGVTANGHLRPRYGFDAGFDRYECLGFSATAEHVNAKLREWGAFVEESDAPVFVWLHYIDPHWAYIRRDPWFTDYAPDARREDLMIFPVIAETWPELPSEVSERPLEFLRLATALYDSEINYWDQHFRALMSEFPRLSRAAAIFTSDHGEEFMDHGDVHHGMNLHAATVRVPLVVWPPGPVEARRVECAVSLVDVPRTLVAWAGGTVPDHWQGVDLMSDCNGDRPILSFLDRVAADRRFEAVTIGSWRLVTEIGVGSPKLYDTVADVSERRNLATAQVATVERLRARLDAAKRGLPPAPEGDWTVPVEGRELEQLEALGYVH